MRTLLLRLFYAFYSMSFLISDVHTCINGIEHLIQVQSIMGYKSWQEFEESTKKRRKNTITIFEAEKGILYVTNLGLRDTFPFNCMNKTLIGIFQYLSSLNTWLILALVFLAMILVYFCFKTYLAYLDLVDAVKRLTRKREKVIADNGKNAQVEVEEFFNMLKARILGNKSLKEELLRIKWEYFHPKNQMIFDNSSCAQEKYMALYKIINTAGEVEGDSYDFLQYQDQNQYHKPRIRMHDPALTKANLEMCYTGLFAKNFNQISLIGKRGIGCVFKATHIIDGNDYAIKIIRLSLQSYENLSDKEEVKEIKAMIKLENPNIIKYITCWFELEPEIEEHEDYRKEDIEDEGENSTCAVQEDSNPPSQCSKSIIFYIQMEYFEAFPLSYYLENRGHEICREAALFIFIQLVSAVSHIHSHQIIHGDLKPSNIMINEFLIVKIVDFGLAADHNRSSSKELSGKVSTPLYQAPEQLEEDANVNEHVYSEKVDVYSLGVILLELCMNFKTPNERLTVIENIRAMSYPKQLESEFMNELKLIKLMTHFDYFQRPSSQDILKSFEFTAIEACCLLRDE